MTKPLFLGKTQRTRADSHGMRFLKRAIAFGLGLIGLPEMRERYHGSAGDASTRRFKYLYTIL